MSVFVVYVLSVLFDVVVVIISVCCCYYFVVKNKCTSVCLPVHLFVVALIFISSSIGLILLMGIQIIS